MFTYESEYKCYSCYDLGYLKLDGENVVAHCWCEAGSLNKKSHPHILQAVRKSNFDFKMIKASVQPKNGEEFWAISEKWKALIKKSEAFWSKNAIIENHALPYKDN